MFYTRPGPVDIKTNNHSLGPSVDMKRPFSSTNYRRESSDRFTTNGTAKAEEHRLSY